MKSTTGILILLFLFTACKSEIKEDQDVLPEIAAEKLEVKYAEGFEISRLDIQDGYKLTIKNPWPGSDLVQSFYILRDAQNAEIQGSKIQLPIDNLIATSTTHITPLVLLDAIDKLKGFPGNDYVSSPAARKLIDSGDIVELGGTESLNVESVISLNPDVVIGYGIDGNNPEYDSVARAGIPVIFNADWTEQHPLGRAEWIKVFGILLDKKEEAFEIFNEIEYDYLAAKEEASKRTKPVVMAGATWKDQWYLPYGNSWQGILIADAGGDYIYKNQQGSGSLAYNLETVLNDARTADVWIAPGQYTSYQQMLDDNSSYKLFDAFQNRELYTFALRQGATGGIIYYEEASMRPDLVLQDLITIFHSDDTDNVELNFFDPLQP